MSKPLILELQEKSNKGYIVAWKSQEQLISQGDNWEFAVDSKETLSDFFELTDNGDIKVLKDCHVHIESKVFIDGSTGEGYVMSKINVNDVNISRALERIENRDFTHVIDSGTCYKLKENDLISLKVEYTSDSGNPKIRAGRQYSSITIYTM